MNVIDWQQLIRYVFELYKLQENIFNRTCLESFNFEWILNLLIQSTAYKTVSSSLLYFLAIA